MNKIPQKIATIVFTLASFPLLNDNYALAHHLNQQCIEVAYSDTFVRNNTKKKIEHHIPLSVGSKNGVSVFFIQGNANGVQAWVLVRNSEGIWEGGNHLLPTLKKTETDEKIVFDWKEVGNLGEHYRVILLIAFPKGEMFDHEIIPHGLNASAVRSITQYPAQVQNGFVYSPFTSLAGGVKKGVSIDNELSQLINEETATGDILIPYTSRNRVTIHNLRTINSFSICK